MALKTTHYRLPYFTSGVYISTDDRTRFTIIDNQLSYLASQIGDGVIEGWNISNLGSNIFKVSEGLGVINDYVTLTYGNYEFELTDNSRYYFYVRKKPEINADRSAFSSMVSISYTDATPPATPTGLSVVETDYNLIKFSWNENTEADFSYYEIYRSTDNISFTKISNSSKNEYTDSDVNQNTTYYYKIKSYDVNQLNNGSFSSVLTTSTLLDTRIPSDPTSLEVINGDATIQILWDSGAFLVDQYYISLHSIDAEGSIIALENEFLVNNDVFSLFIDNLINGQSYLVTVKSLSITGVQSPGVSTTVVPVATSGAQQLSGFTWDDFLVDSSYNVGINISWEIQSDSYLPDPDYYIVTIEKDGQLSEPTIFLTNSIILHQYTFNNNIIKIFENTNYTIHVQTATSDGVISQPFKLRLKTKKFSKPGPVTNLNINFIYNVNTKNITITWQNTTSEFSYNTITIKRRSLNSSSSSLNDYIEEDLNYGKAEKYKVLKNEIYNNSIYTVIIKTFDFAGNQSEESSTTAVINEIIPGVFVPGFGETDESRPPAPLGLNSISGNDSVTISWQHVESDNIVNYCVWRARYNLGSYLPEDFSKIAELDYKTNSYVDYDVENDLKYSYFVTSKDVFGIESLNPIDDDFVGYIIEIGEPRNFSNLSKPSGLLASTNVNDVILTWSSDTESFDGYEIYLSIGDKSHFSKIDTVSSFENSYVHSSALIESGTYYYMIRKFRDEAEIFYTESNSSPVDSLQIGSITLIDSIATINNDLKYDIKLLKDPVKEEVKRQFSQPVHIYYGVGDDRRIRLSKNLTVTNWTTNNYKEYDTVSDIRGTNTYIVYINGQQSLFSSYIDKDKGILYFEDFIVDSTTITDTNPAPEIVVIFFDTEEVQGKLKPENIGNIIGNKITKGKLNQNLLGNLDHLGRYREKCIPFSYETTRLNGNTFSAATPAGTSFYDIIITETGRIVAATNEGIKATKVTDGTNWEVLLTSNMPANVIYYSSVHEWYIAILVDKIFYSENLINWIEIPGITNSNIIKNVKEDNLGNIFVYSDNGIYKLNPNTFYKLQFQQCSIVDIINNDIYALFIENDIMYATVKDGIYVSYDQGDIWNKYSTSVNTALYDLKKINSIFYGVSQNKIWRQKNSTFAVIATFPFNIRKIEYFNNRIYVTSDSGLYKSTSDITEDNVEFDLAYKNISINGIIPAVLNAKVINSKLYLMMDEKIYSVSVKGKTSLHADLPGINPIIYINGIERSVGIFYGFNNIVSDTRLLPDDIVTIVRDYTKFNVKNGGWADIKYDAEITLVINDQDQLPIVKPKTDATTLADSVKTIITPFFNARTANFEEAMKYLKIIVQLVDQVDTDALLTPDKNIEASNIANIFQNVQLFKLNLNEEVRNTIILPSITAGTTSDSGYSYEVDVVNGVLTINTGVTKYTKVALSLKDVGIINTGTYTHEEIENALEKVNSGASAGFSSVKQSNLIKMGIQQEIADPLYLAEKKLQYQSDFFAACDPWYNKLKSTIDYNLELTQDVLKTQFGEGSFSLNYPSDVIYVSSTGTVWVCGQGGILGINTTSLEVFEILNKEFYFYNMHQNGDLIYTLSEDGLYTININNYNVEKLIDIELLENASSVLSFGDTLFLATDIGLYFRRNTDLTWQNLFKTNKSFVRSSQKVNFCVGNNPDTEDLVSEVYYSTSGINWNRSNQFADLIITSVTQRYDSVYYATDKGVIVEDLSGLFSGQEIQINPIDLNGDDESDNIFINSIDSDNQIVVAGDDQGYWYLLGGNEVISKGKSPFNTIHKVKAVNGKYWLFADNLITIQGENKIINLSTGVNLI